MARNDIGFYKTNSNSIPAIVLEEWRTWRVVDGTTGETTDSGTTTLAEMPAGATVDEENVDVLLFGVDQGKRYNVPAVATEAAALPNQFARGL